MNPHKPPQIFATFKDYFKAEVKRLTGTQKDDSYYKNPKASHAFKEQLENAVRGEEILNKSGLQHFILPDNGQLMDDHLMEKPFKEIIVKYLGDQKLPYPLLSIEFNITGEQDEEIENLCSLLIVENVYEENDSSPYIKIEAIHSLKVKGKVINYAVPEIFILDVDASRIESRKGICCYYIDKDGQKAILQENISNAYSTISKVIALLVALSCKNVTHTKSKSPSIKQNQMRQKKGLTSLKTYSYIVVDTSDSSPVGVAAPSKGTGKSTHIRRGHIRHYENKNVWIEQTVINPNKTDLVQKTYKVK